MAQAGIRIFPFKKPTSSNFNNFSKAQKNAADGIATHRHIKGVLGLHRMRAFELEGLSLQTEIDASLRIQCTYANQIGAALHQNAIPAINEFTLQNDLGRDLHNVLVELTSEPSFTRPITWRLDDFREGAVHRIQNPALWLG